MSETGLDEFAVIGSNSERFEVGLRGRGMNWIEMVGSGWVGLKLSLS